MRGLIFFAALLACAPGFARAQSDGAKPPAAAAPAPAASAPIPLDYFGELPFIEAPEVSPDGTRIAARIAIRGQQRFAIFQLNNSSHPIIIGVGDEDLLSWSWVNNDWLVATVGATSSVEGDSWYLSRAISISADGKKILMLGQHSAAQNASDILWRATDGSPHILLAMQTSIYQDDVGLWPEVRNFDISTGKSSLVAPSVANVHDWYADGAGNVRMGVGYDDARLSHRLLYRDRQGDSFRTVSRARGRGASLGDIPAMFLPEPGKAVAYNDDDGFDALYSFDLTTLKRGEKLYGVPGYDLGELITADGNTRMLGVRYSDDRPRTHWFDPGLAKVQADIDQAVGSRQAQIVSWSRDFSVLVVLLGGGDRPGAYYIYRPEEGAMHQLAKVNEDLGNSGYGPVSTIRYKARDGLEISAVLTLPRGKAAKDLPLIMMPHGGPHVRDDESWDWWAQFLASRGYAVLQPNYRGSSGFGTDFSYKAKGQWGLAMQDDLIDAIKWAAGKGIADPKRVCIVGGSYGGYAALRAAQRDHGVYRCAVSYAGVSDINAILRYDSSFLNNDHSSRDYWQNEAADLKAASPINFPADFSIPVLIMHGKADQRVPVKQSRLMAERLKAAGKTYRYVEQPKGDHHFTGQADRIQFLKEMEAFLAEYNPA